MAYNKAREERKWRIWKEAEEKKLRELGVDKDTIERLHVYDWAVFNSERRYYEKKKEVGTYLEDVAENRKQPEIRTVENLLDDIEDEKMHELLLNVDKLTLQIALWKVEGYSSAEISAKCGLSVDAINFRIWHLRKKIKNIF